MKIRAGGSLMSMMVCRRMWRMIAVVRIPKAFVALDFGVVYGIEDMNTVCNATITSRAVRSCSMYCR